jgi:hypothetical protein
MNEFFTDALPYISQGATLLIAGATVLFARKSSKEVGVRELSTKMWEKRTDTYTEILRAVQDLDPTRRPTPEGFAERSTEASDSPPQDMDLYSRDLESEDWQEFTARVESFASDEVRFLFNLWLAALAGWSWLTMKCLIHHETDRAKYFDAKAELERCYTATDDVCKELTSQIRAELSFKNRHVRKVSVAAPEGFLGAVIDVEFTKGRQVDLEPPRAARLVSVRRGNGGEHSSTVRLP